MPTPELIRKELDERAANNLIDFVAGTTQLVLQQSFDYTTDFPGFIASPIDEPGPFGVAKAIAQQSCRRWARGEGIPSLPGFDAFYGGICGPYLDSLGESPSDGSLELPFEGGQCAGVLYNVSVTGILPPNAPQTFEANIVGPLRYNADLPPVPPDPGCTGGSSWQRFSIAGSGGSTITWVGCDADLVVNYVNPLGGGANNCGNPTPIYETPVSAPGLPPLQPINVNVPGIGPVEVDVSFDDDGNINVSLPGLGLEVTVPNPLAPGDDGGDDDDGIPGDQGQPGLPAVGGDGEPAEGGDNDRVLLGVKVDLLSSPPRANQIFNETEAYTKGAYFVYLGGDAGFEQIPSAAIVRDEQFYTAPEGCNRFRVVPNVGFTILVTPYYERED